MSNFTLLVIGLSAVSFVGAGGYALFPKETFDSSCDIKGNISIGSGERIFYVPGQENYLDTVIRVEYGERWFCSEADARAAGWRKAGR
ncbi:hypothetical protein [Pararhizobium arenae]|uniref:sunset domain-containing protein n=1 Tax=Pararhizobium arenae TaxID=1856850 RepID=UPI00094AC588|nr:hypothetical protein [Pararhizobium arenae]